MMTRTEIILAALLAALSLVLFTLAVMESSATDPDLWHRVNDAEAANHSTLDTEAP